MPLSCSSCSKGHSKKLSATKRDDDLSCSGCCAPMCNYVQDPKVLEAVGTVKKHCFPAVDAPSQVQSEFGFSLALSPDGTVLVVGAPGYNVGNVQKAGAVFVFERLVSYAFCKDCSDGEFTLVQVLTADVPDDADINSFSGNFGQSVAISGDKSRIAVGAPFQDVGPSTEINEDEGAVFIFERKREHDGVPMKYCLVQKVVAQRRTSATDCTVVRDNGKQFGYRIALSRNGRVLVVTDPLYPFAATGRIYIYEDCSLGLSFSPCPEKRDPFQFRQRIDQEQVADDSGFSVVDLVAIGNSVATTEDGATIVFGAALATVSGAQFAGLVFVYRRCCHDKSWIYCQTQNAGSRSAINSGFGVAVAITPCGKYLAVEAGEAVSVPSGFAIVYKEQNGQYTQDGNVLTATNLEDNAFYNNIFGQRSIAISDNGCVVAVGFEVTTVSNVSQSGDVAIFDRKREPTSDGAGCETKWVSRQMLENPQPQAPSFFGTAIAMSASAETLAISAPSVTDFLVRDEALAFTYRSQFKGRPCQ